MLLELDGKVDRIGLAGTHLVFLDPPTDQLESLPIASTDHTAATEFLIGWLEQRHHFTSIQAVGHRIVHGMAHAAPALVTPDLMEELMIARSICRVLSLTPQIG